MKILRISMVIISSFLLTLSLAACSKKDKMKSLSNNLEIKTNLKNMDVAFYKNKSTNYAIQFLAVSNKKLNKNNISFKTDNSMLINFNMEDASDIKSDYYDYLITQKLDWKEMGKAMLSDNPEKLAEIGDKLNSYQEDYLKDGLSMENYHVYQFTLNFDVPSESKNETDIVKDIMMFVDNEKFTFEVGYIEFLKQEENGENESKVDQISAIGRVGKKVIPDVYKRYNEDINDWQFEVHDDVNIKNIDVLQKDMTIEDTTVRIKKKNGSVIEKVFKGGSINLNLKKGDKFIINPVFKKKKTNQIIYHQTYNYRICFENENDKDAIIVESGILSTTDTAYKIMNEDNLFEEYQSYYENFAKHIEE